MDKKISNTRSLSSATVLQTIIENKDVSRAFISKQTKLSKPAVSDIVTELINENLVLEKGSGESSVYGGRKPILLEFNADCASIISLDVSPDIISYCLSNLDGSQYMFDTACLKSNNSLIVSQIKEIITQLINKNGDTIPIIAISIAIHGMTVNNQIVYTPNYKLDQIDLYQTLIDEFNIQVYINNEANLSALGEFTFGNYPESLININIHYGVGAGILENGQLVTGHHGLVGEMGHSIIVPFGRLCPCGNEGCLEQYISIPSLMKELEENEVDIHNIRKEWEQNPICQMILRKNFQYLGVTLNNLITILEPELIVINSEILSEIPELFTEIHSVINNKYAQNIPIKASNLAFNTSILGCIAFATRQYLQVDTIKFNCLYYTQNRES